MYDVMGVATYVVTYFSSQRNPITHLKLQKLLYFLWVDYYRSTSQPLFEDNICAWRLGPVVPEVYSEFCVYSSIPIDMQYPVNISEQDQRIMNQTLDSLGQKSASCLVDITHREGSAWDVIYANGAGSRNVIPFNLIVEREMINAPL